MLKDGSATGRIAHVDTRNERLLFFEDPASHGTVAEPPRRPGTLRGAIALTFDDGPDPRWTPRILDALTLAAARATFFVIAPRALAERYVVERILSDGHRVELHCHDHVRHTDRTEYEVTRDVEHALVALDVLGVRPRLWRIPWGVRAPFTERVADRFGLHVVGWDADTHDWRGDDAATMVAAIAPKLTEGAIVLAHDGLGPGATRSGCAATVELIELLAREANTRDLRLGALDAAGRPA